MDCMFSMSLFDMAVIKDALSAQARGLAGMLEYGCLRRVFEVDDLVHASR